MEGKLLLLKLSDINIRKKTVADQETELEV